MRFIKRSEDIVLDFLQGSFRRMVLAVSRWGSSKQLINSKTVNILCDGSTFNDLAQKSQVRYGVVLLYFRVQACFFKQLTLLSLINLDKNA